MWPSAGFAGHLPDGAMHGHNALRRQARELIVQPVDVLGVHVSELTRLLVQQQEELVRQRRAPPIILRAEDEGSPHFEVRKRVGLEHVALHDV